MLVILRTLIVIIYSILVCVLGCIWCLFSPRNPRHVATFGHLFGALAPLFGVKVEVRSRKARSITATPSISLTIRTTTI